MERALAQGEPAASAARAKALEGMGCLTQLQGDYDKARANFEEMLELSRELGDRGNVATALNSLGTVAAQQGNNERAKALLRENLGVLEKLEEEGNPNTTLKRFHVINLLGYLAIYAEGDYARGENLWEESLALAREAEDMDQTGLMLSNLGYPAVLRGDYERARKRCEEALAVAHELGDADVGFALNAHVNLGLAALGLGDNERAMKSFREALLLGQKIGMVPQVIETLEGMASLMATLGEATRVARLWGAAEAARETTGISLSPGERTLHEPYLASARSRLGEAAWEEALAEGRAMSLDQAAEYALSKVTDQPEATVLQEPSDHEPSGKLTRRELEVTVLVARGHTNREISRELSISERTAGNHVAKILRKLGLRSRTQIATWTAESGLSGSEQ